MGFNRFSLLLAVRLALIFSGLIAVGYLISIPGYHAATLLAILITVALAYEVYTFISRTNQELSRFLDAVRYADFGQRFQFGAVGAGFETLGETFTHILERFREDRREQETELRHLKAMMEHVPVPLISIYNDGTVTTWNNAARRLFGSTHVATTEDLKQFGDEFHQHLTRIQAGERYLTTFRVDGLEVRLTVSASELTIASKVERLISLMNIQTELDSTQLSAWQDLVRVLTHEIMNSITPVTSLAKTAVDLVDDAASRVNDESVIEELKDARNAVDTVARRSDGLMNFVSSYRRLTRPPAPQPGRFAIRELFDDVVRIASQDLPENIQLTSSIEPQELDLQADRQQIEQVLINLVQNAVQACENENADISLQAHINRRGHVMLEVSDDGPGIPEDIASRIFVPFYTTRREGSGIGLALSRQIMLAHGGTITFNNRPTGGATFTLIF